MVVELSKAIAILQDGSGKSYRALSRPVACFIIGVLAMTVLETLAKMECYGAKGLLYVREGLHVENNSYGADAAGMPHDQSVYLRPVSQPDLPLAGWKWGYVKAWNRAGSVVAYPEVIHGRKPWAGNSNTTNFPRRLDGLGNIALYAKYWYEATGVFNVAVDCWIGAYEKSGPDDIRAEVMFWPENSEMQPAGRMIGTFGDWILNHADPTQGRPWHYFAFVRSNEPSHKGLRQGCDINLSEGIEELRKLPGILANSDYLMSVEFGTEIVNGTGAFLLDDFAVSCSA